MSIDAAGTGLAVSTGSGRILFFFALALVAGAAFFCLRALRERLRRREREIEILRDREAQRVEYCEALGHLLDASCLCTRCLTFQHSYEQSTETTVATGTELVNPNADPGALYLSADFQPDWDCGLTHTRYETESTCRCTRCGDEKKATVAHYS